MKYLWCIFDNVPSVPGTQLWLKECIPMEVCTRSAQSRGWGLQKARMLLPWVLHVRLTALSLCERPAQLPPNKCRGRGGEKGKKSTTSPDSLCSELRSYKEWYFSHCSFPVTMGSKKAFFKKSFFSQFMAEHSVASSKMK